MRTSRNVANTTRSWSRDSRYRSVGLDRSLLLCVFALMGIGLVLIYSASFIFASQKFSDGLYFFKRQSIFVVLALTFMGFASYFPYQYLRKFFWGFMAVLLGLLALLYVPGLAHKAGGATRWIMLPLGFHMEPSEIAKLMAPVIFSYWLVYQRREKVWVYSLKVLLTTLVPLILLLKQPDFGAAVIFSLIGVALLFCFGLKLRYLLLSFLILVPAGAYLILSEPYRKARFMSFLNPWSDPANSGFQVIQSMLGLHAGGLWGAGLGKGQAKLFFLPEAHTDFILAVLGEETGFIGLVLVLSLFAWLVFRGVQISMGCSDPFGKSLALGLSSFIGFQALINCGVVTGFLPTKGLAMPFLSYGGSSLIVVSLACGVLINIHRSQGSLR